MSRFLRSRHDDQGVVALELVLAMPILLMLIVGTIVLGNFFNLKTRTTGCAREGARDVALGGTVPDCPGAANATFTILQACPPKTDPTFFDSDAQVVATMPVSLRSFPLVPVDFLPATITETVTMRCGG